MKTVIQLITSLSDGGAETLVKDYAIVFNNNSELGIKPVIVTINNDIQSANYKRLQEQNIRVISIYKHRSKLISLLRVLFGAFYIPFMLLNILKEIKPDSIHVHLGILRHLLPIRNKLIGVNLFYTCHNLPELMLDGKRKAEGRAAKTLIQHNNLQMIALHSDMAKQINKMFSIDNTIVINNGIDIKKFSKVERDRSEIRTNIGIPTDAFVIGHIGRFTEQKNHVFLIDIFYELLKQRPNSHILLIGNGPYSELIKNKVRDYGLVTNAHFLEHRTDTHELLKAMDVFVFPSLFEGLPVTLVEAQASGLRCIISDRINKQSILSKHTIPISLKKSPKEWCELILNDQVINDDYGDLLKYDINTELEKLALLY